MNSKGGVMFDDSKLKEIRKDKPSVVICIPVYNDWESVALLIERLDEAASVLGSPTSVLLVDDGSSDAVLNMHSLHLKSIERVDVLKLRRNVGHQRAIALGLSFIYSYMSCREVVVMDGDGEDDPRDIIKLINRSRENNHGTVVFAKRAKRSEGLLFKMGYLGFKMIHRILTGRKVEVGNFSVIPCTLLGRLLGVTEIWNHYAASVFKARIPTDMLPISRSRRLSGTSKMSITSLITHGMSAISVFGEIVGVRLLCFTGGIMVLFSLGLGPVISIRLLTHMEMPVWAIQAAGFLILTLINLMFLAAAFVLLIMQSRNSSGFLPLRDWVYYVESHQTLLG